MFLILSNNTLSRAELNYENGKYKNIHYGDVLIKFSAFIDVSSPDVPYINDENSSSKLDNILLQDGDIIIADTAEDFTVGKATEVENIDKIKVVSGLHTIFSKVFRVLCKLSRISQPTYTFYSGSKSQFYFKNTYQEDFCIVPKSFRTNKNRGFFIVFGQKNRNSKQNHKT